MMTVFYFTALTLSSSIPNAKTNFVWLVALRKGITCLKVDSWNCLFDYLWFWKGLFCDLLIHLRTMFIVIDAWTSSKHNVGGSYLVIILWACILTPQNLCFCLRSQTQQENNLMKVGFLEENTELLISATMRSQF